MRTVTSVPPVVSAKFIFPAVSILEPGKERQLNSRPTSWSIISAFHCTEGMLPGVWSTQRECISSITFIFFICFTKRGSPSRFLHESYASFLGALTMKQVRIFAAGACAFNASSFCKRAEITQLPEMPLYKQYKLP